MPPIHGNRKVVIGVKVQDRPRLEYQMDVVLKRGSASADRLGEQLGRAWAETPIAGKPDLLDGSPNLLRPT